MKKDPPGQVNDNAPEFVLPDGNLRSSTWRTEGKYGPLFNTRITKIFRDDDGEFRETSTLGSKDLLRAGELARETHAEVLKRQREHAKERRDEREDMQHQPDSWHDEDKRRDEIKRERFKDERQPSRGTRRAKPRDRAAR